MKRHRKRKFVICLSNKGYRASLEALKIYEQLSDSDAEQHGMIRIIDESGEDYLYSARRFIPINLPKNVEEAVDALNELQPA